MGSPKSDLIRVPDIGLAQGAEGADNYLIDQNTTEFAVVMLDKGDIWEFTDSISLAASRSSSYTVVSTPVGWGTSNQNLQNQFAGGTTSSSTYLNKTEAQWTAYGVVPLLNASWSASDSWWEPFLPHDVPTEPTMQVGRLNPKSDATASGYSMQDWQAVDGTFDDVSDILVTWQTQDGSNLRDHHIVLAGAIDGAGRDEINGLLAWYGHSEVNSVALLSQGNDYIAGTPPNPNYYTPNESWTQEILALSGNDTVAAFAQDWFEDHAYHGSKQKVYGGGGSDSLDGGAGNDSLYGNADNDVLIGGFDDDYLEGGQGADLLIGGSGDDIYVVDGNDTIVEKNGVEDFNDPVWTSLTEYVNPNQTSQANTQYGITIASLSTTATYGTTKTAFEDSVARVDGISHTRIWKEELTQTLQGTTGFIQSPGSQWKLFSSITVSGTGLSTNVYTTVLLHFDTLSFNITSQDSGRDEIRGDMDIDLRNSRYANVENATALGTQARHLTGSAAANVLTSNGAGSMLEGLDGDDSYYLLSGEDRLIEAANAGHDAVFTISDIYRLADNVEDLHSNGIGLTLYGNTLANRIVGDAQANLIDGGAGADVVEAGLGDDSYVVTTNEDAIVELGNAGRDTVWVHSSYTLGSTGSNDIEIMRAASDRAVYLKGNTLGQQLIAGAAGDDTLDGGGGGADSLFGGGGNDTLVLNSPSDVAVEDANGGDDTVQVAYSNIGSTAITITAGSGGFVNVEHLRVTGSGLFYLVGDSRPNRLTGNVAANSLIGGDGNDTLDGGIGADTMSGGFGDDRYIVDNAGDLLTEASGAGVDEVHSSVNWNLGAYIENLLLTGTADLAGVGNDSANMLTGNSANNALSGGAGNDTLDGGTGSDSLAGGSGDDLYLVDNTSDVITELPGAGIDTVSTSLTWTLSTTAELENLTLTGTAAINARGNALANRLHGNTAANRLDGGLGADVLSGSAGNDTYVVDNVGDLIFEVAGGGTDTVEASISWTLGTEIENLTLTGTAALNATGNALANVLTGNSGSNRLDGAAGADALFGGAGNDTYVVDNLGDTTMESVGGGTDTVEASVSWTLGVELDNLTLTGAAALNGTGNSLPNTLTGNTGANVLVGGAGNDWLNGLEGGDTLVGGIGSDHYVVDNVADTVTELAAEGVDQVYAKVSWTLGAHLDNLTLWGTSALSGTGNELANRLTGNDAANALSGAAGDDTLYGAGGGDTLYGGSGNDSLIADARLETIVVKARASLAGNVGANMEVRLDGALIGSALVSSTTFADYTFTATVSAGKDAKLDVTFTNDAVLNGEDRNLFVESVRVGSHAMKPTDAGVTRDIGSGAAAFDGLNVQPGDGVLPWNASLRFTVPAAVVGAVAGDDLLYGDAGNDYLSGGAGNDRLEGGADADVLDGGGGNDTYIGGLGSDSLTDASTLSNEVYVWGRGEGADMLTDAGGTDRLDVLAGVAENQVWLRKVGNNLELSVIGTSDSLTINGWYSGAANQVESFRLADGQALLASQVQQLVDAMAAFVPPAPGQTSLPANYHAALNPVIAPSWA